MAYVLCPNSSKCTRQTNGKVEENSRQSTSSFVIGKPPENSPQKRAKRRHRSSTFFVNFTFYRSTFLALNRRRGNTENLAIYKRPHQLDCRPLFFLTASWSNLGSICWQTESTISYRLWEADIELFRGKYTNLLFTFATTLMADAQDFHFLQGLDNCPMFRQSAICEWDGF